MKQHTFYAFQFRSTVKVVTVMCRFLAIKIIISVMLSAIKLAILDCILSEHLGTQDMLLLV